MIAGVTALVTLGVAIATFRTAAATRDAAKATGAEAEASEKLVHATQVQMRRAQMPVVMPIANAHMVRGGDPRDRIPRLPAGGVLDVPIANVGLGPAFDIEAAFQFLDEKGNPSVAPQPVIQRPPVFSALGAGQEVGLRAVFTNLAGPPLLPFFVSISYQDTFGGDYEATAIYDPELKTYQGITFRSPSDLEPPTAVPEQD